MRKTKLEKISLKVLSMMIGLIFVTTILGYAIYNIIGTNLGSSKYTRVADPNTMDNYQKLLLSDKNGSRYAGRVWSDKTVINYQTSNHSLSLDEPTDGYAKPVEFDADFLHVFSALGSSQVVDQYTSKPIDVVLLLDISSSMTNKRNGNVDTNDSLHQVINETNTLINQLMGKDPNYQVHEDNRVGVVVYGGGAQVLLPLGHYTANSGNTYIRILDNDITNKTTSSTAYFPKVTTNVKETTKTTDFMVADSTYLQGALYEGMNMLANEQNTSYRDPVTETRIPRTPVMITLTDGATNIVSATQTSHGGSNTFEWYHPRTGIIPTAGGNTQYAKPGQNPFYANCNTSTGNGTSNLNIEVQAIAPRNVSNLLLAGYYKNKIESNYRTDMVDFSIGYNIGGVRTIW